MSNHDLIFPYAAHFDEWLTQQGYPHPAVRPGNRLPTFDDIDWALAAYPELEIEPRWSSDDSRSVVEKNQIGYALYFEHLNWKTHMAEPESDFMTVRGSRHWEFALLIKLGERCGQLVLYPDTGEPAVILDSDSDLRRIDQEWSEASSRPDPWAYLYEPLYS